MLTFRSRIRLRGNESVFLTWFRSNLPVVVDMMDIKSTYNNNSFVDCYWSLQLTQISNNQTRYIQNISVIQFQKILPKTQIVPNFLQFLRPCHLRMLTSRIRMILWGNKSFWPGLGVTAHWWMADIGSTYNNSSFVGCYWSLQLTQISNNPLRIPELPKLWSENG